jgi:hypothetical protein
MEDVEEATVKHQATEISASTIEINHDDEFGRGCSTVHTGTISKERRHLWILTKPQYELLRELLAEGLGTGMIVFFGTGAVMSAILKDALGM